MVDDTFGEPPAGFVFLDDFLVDFDRFTFSFGSFVEFRLPVSLDVLTMTSPDVIVCCSSVLVVRLVNDSLFSWVTRMDVLTEPVVNRPPCEPTSGTLDTDEMDTSSGRRASLMFVSCRDAEDFELDFFFFFKVSPPPPFSAESTFFFRFFPDTGPLVVVAMTGFGLNKTPFRNK